MSSNMRQRDTAAASCANAAPQPPALELTEPLAMPARTSFRQDFKLSPIRRVEEPAAMGREPMARQ